jgi:hypothetical protein
MVSDSEKSMAHARKEFEDYQKKQEKLREKTPEHKQTQNLL